MIVAGVPHKALDHKGHYRKQCQSFADDYGFKRDEVYKCWQQLALMRELECEWPRSVAGWQAMRDVRRFFYTPGAEDAN